MSGSPHAPDGIPRVVVQRDIHVVEIATRPIAHEVLSEREGMILAAVRGKLSCCGVPVAALVPHARGYVIDPRCAGRREVKNVEAMALILVGIAYCVGESCRSVGG